MRTGWVTGLVLMLLVADDIAAQAMRSESRARALPRNEFAIGIDQWQYSPDSGDPSGSWTRWGFSLVSRSSLLGQWNLGEQDGALLIGDYLETGVGFFGATGKRSGRKSPVLRLPLHWGVQLGTLTEDGTQLVGRVGVAGGLSSTSYLGPFLGARVKRQGLGAESAYVFDANGSVTSVLLRWYPRARLEGFNIALRYERQQYDPSGLFSLTKGSEDRTLTILFSAER